MPEIQPPDYIRQEKLELPDSSTHMVSRPLSDMDATSLVELPVDTSLPQSKKR